MTQYLVDAILPADKEAPLVQPTAWFAFLASLDACRGVHHKRFLLQCLSTNATLVAFPSLDATIRWVRWHSALLRKHECAQADPVRL